MRFPDSVCITRTGTATAVDAIFGQPTGTVASTNIYVGSGFVQGAKGEIDRDDYGNEELEDMAVIFLPPNSDCGLKIDDRVVNGSREGRVRRVFPYRERFYSKVLVKWDASIL